MDESQARLIFDRMSFEECIKMWNESLDHYTRDVKITYMVDDYWWEWLSKYVGGFRLISDLLSSGDRFNLKDMYFFYDEGCGVFFSFSTKQELIECLGEGFFIKEIQNANYSR